MDFLTQLWSYESFRASILALVRLPEEAIRRLAQIDLPAELDSAERDEVGVSSLSLEALQIVRSHADEDEFSPADVVDALAALAENADQSLIEEKRVALIEVFTSSEAAVRAQHKRTTQAAIHPVLVASRALIDFRSTKDPITDAPRFLPVVSVRLTFDEPMGGSNAISFQVSTAGLEEVLETLHDVQAELEEAKKSLGEMVIE
jgi:hypothetical protein